MEFRDTSNSVNRKAIIRYETDMGAELSPAAADQNFAWICKQQQDLIGLVLIFRTKIIWSGPEFGLVRCGYLNTVNVTGLYKLPLHLAKPLLYTISGTFLYFVSLPCTCVPRTDRQTGITYYFHSNVHFLTVAMPKMLWSKVHAGNRDSGTWVQNLFPSQP